MRDRRQRIEARLVDVKALLARQKVESREALERQVQKAVDADEKYRLALTNSQVNILLGRAREAFAQQDYEECRQICEAVLNMDAMSLEAKTLLKKSVQVEANWWRVHLEDENREQVKKMFVDLDEAAVPYAETFTFPDRDFWKNRVQKRESEISIGDAEESQEIKEIRRRLETTKINLDFEDRPLADVVEFIKKIAQINIHIDKDVDAEETKVRLQLNDAVLKEALDLIMINTGLAYTFRNNLLVITTPEQARGVPIFKIYNVTDILSKVRDFPGPTLDIRTPDEEGEEGAPGGQGFTFGEEEQETTISAEDLVTLVRDSTGGEEVWGEPMSLEAHRGQLLVEATRELHVKVKKVLGELRRDSDLFVVVRARFIDITDDFLEDIGIDYRNLGQRNTPWRRTYGGRIHDSRTGGQDVGFIDGGLGTEDPELAGRMQNMLDGFSSLIRGSRVVGGPGGLSGLSLQFMMVDPYQINAIIRAVQEEAGVRSVIAPEVTAHNGQRVFVSVITQRSYIADYELVSGGTTYTLTEVADPVVRVNEEGVVLDVRPTVSADRKYITIDVQPTLATLIGGVISTVLINLGTVMAAAMQVPIGLPKMSIQRTWTSVTVPDGGTVLLGGFRSLDELRFTSTIPIIGKIPILNLLVRRRAELREKRSLIILITAKMVNLRQEEAEKFGL